MPRRPKPKKAESNPASPAPGTPEFRALIEQHKDFIEQQTGMRPAFILDIGAGDIPGYGDPECYREPESPRKRRR